MILEVANLMALEESELFEDLAVLAALITDFIECKTLLFRAVLRAV